MTDNTAFRQPIGFVDSGIGGLPYLKKTRALLRNECFTYLADCANFPYGSRGRDDVELLVTNAVERLVREAEPKLVVVACNTASVVSLDTLRSRFSVPFVGVVPAIKPAAEQKPGGRIGVLATERTTSDPYIAELALKYGRNSQIVPVPAPGLVEAIENGGGHLTGETVRCVADAVAALISARVETVVLGCTHFVHVRDELERGLGKIPVHDSVDGVAKQVVRVNTDLPGDAGCRGDVLLATGDRALNGQYGEISARYGMSLRWCDARD